MKGRETSERHWRPSVPRPLYSIFIALQFLTRFPIPLEPEASSRDVGRSIAWFPLVGLLIGLFVLCVDRVASAILATPVVDALVVWTLVAVTGALHLDGLMDTADGISTGPGAETRLAAMRQSTVGVTGALAGCALILAGYAALSGLTGNVRSVALLLAPLCGRAAILLGYGAFPYPRPEPGVSLSLKEGATPSRVGIGLLVAGGACGIVAGVDGLLLLCLALGLALGIARLVLTRLPGLTGDNHGAICELSQLAVLIGAPVVLAQ